MIRAPRSTNNLLPPSTSLKRKSTALDEGVSAAKHKHKSRNETEPDSESDSETDTVQQAPVKRGPGRPRKDPAAKEVAGTKSKSKSKHKSKRRKVVMLAAGSDIEGDSEMNTVQRAPAKRGPGRPRKDPAAKKIAKRTSFIVPCYVSVPQAPNFIAGKTVKGDKYVKRPSETVGPFDLTSKTKFRSFLNEIASLANIEAEKINSPTSGMKWGVGKPGSMPLSDRRGYKTMLSQISARKDIDQVMIFITLPPSCTAHQEKENIGLDDGRMGRPGRDGTMYGQKVSFTSWLSSKHSHIAFAARA